MIDILIAHLKQRPQRHWRRVVQLDGCFGESIMANGKLTGMFLNVSAKGVEIWRHGGETFALTPAQLRQVAEALEDTNAKQLTLF